MGAGRVLVGGSSPSQDRGLECGSWGNAGSGRGRLGPTGEIRLQEEVMPKSRRGNVAPEG